MQFCKIFDLGDCGWDAKSIIRGWQNSKHSRENEKYLWSTKREGNTFRWMRCRGIFVARKFDSHGCCNGKEQ